MPEAIRVLRTAGGALTYAIPLPPESLPPVPPRSLLAAWDAARDGAETQRWGPARTLLFPRPEGGATEIAIADRDAGAWAEAIDSNFGLDSLAGLSLCLRLLALVEAMTRLSWLVGLYDVTTTGIELHPALLNAAATMPLDAGARFDEAGLQRILSRRLGRSRTGPDTAA